VLENPCDVGDTMSIRFSYKLLLGVVFSGINNLAFTPGFSFVPTLR
jgi:hypothetical protein